MPDLKFDLDEFDRAIEIYSSTAQNIIALKDFLSKHIEALRSVYWQSTGGDAFMEKYNDSWADNVMRYAVVLEKFSGMIQRARNDYAGIEAEAKNIHF